MELTKALRERQAFGDIVRGACVWGSGRELQVQGDGQRELQGRDTHNGAQQPGMVQELAPSPYVCTVDIRSSNMCGRMWQRGLVAATRPVSCARC